MMKRLFKFFLILVGAGGVISLCIITRVQLKDINAIAKQADDLNPAPIAIVLGASVKLDGSPSDALSDRILTATELYQAGKVEKILMTGDDGAFHADEVDAMARTAREAGVPERDILIDGHGYRTYESCKRGYRFTIYVMPLLLRSVFTLDARSIYATISE